MRFTKKIILTGSAGQIGQAFLNHLSNSEDNYIYALDKKKSKNNKENIQNVEIDITKEDEVLDFFSGINR